MKHVSKMMGAIRKAVLFILTLVVVLLCGLYIQCEVYRFPPIKPFSGDYFYNPYQSDSSSSWAKANFHAHAIAWCKATNGRQQPDEIIAAYKKMGYDIACISNYQDMVSIADFQRRPMIIPVYEHGFNISKTHQLVFQPSGINFFDLPFFQTCSIRQSVLNSLAKRSKTIALNHPAIRNGYPEQDLKHLSGYDLMEVLNRKVTSTAQWDTVLSSGKAVWCIGNDDVHNIEQEKEIGVCWTMIADISNTGDILERLKGGKAFIVRGQRGINFNGIEHVLVHSDTLALKLTHMADEVRLIGQDGVVAGTFTNVDSVSYVFHATDTYIRTEIKTNNQELYLNPIIRYDGKSSPSNPVTATVDWLLTCLYRLFVFLLGITILTLIYWKSIVKYFIRWRN